MSSLEAIIKFAGHEPTIFGPKATAPIFTTFPAEHISNYTGWFINHCRVDKVLLYWPLLIGWHPDFQSLPTYFCGAKIQLPPLPQMRSECEPSWLKLNTVRVNMYFLL